MMNLRQDEKVQKKKIIIFEDNYSLTQHLMKVWIETAQRSVEQSNRFTVALTGGRSPMEFYCKLSQFQEFDIWRRTHVFWGDERLVPPDDERSNYRMVRENILDFITLPPENVHPIATGQKSTELCAEQFKNDLAGFFEFREANAPRFDLILLSLGDDGHIASLFANDPNVDDPNRIVLPVSLLQLKEDRVSLALPAINNARSVIVLVMGPAKADVFNRLIKGKSDIPASKIDPKDGQLTFMLNKEAARDLPYRDSFVQEGPGILFNPETS